MSKKESHIFDNSVLMFEAILLILDVIFGFSTKTGMLCYWSIVALYHLSNIILESKRD